MKNIIVVPYDDKWEVEFNRIKDELSVAVTGLFISIEHVGSTSVKGLWAKPIIDIDIVIKKSDFLLIKKALEIIGYIHEGDLGITGRDAFKYNNKPHLMKHHLYVCEENSCELKRHISLRNFLREHDDERNKYSEIKIEMAKKYFNDINSYIEGKSSVILDIYKKCGLT